MQRARRVESGEVGRTHPSFAELYKQIRNGQAFARHTDIYADHDRDKRKRGGSSNTIRSGCGDDHAKNLTVYWRVNMTNLEIAMVIVVGGMFLATLMWSIDYLFNAGRDYRETVGNRKPDGDGQRTEVVTDGKDRTTGKVG